MYHVHDTFHAHFSSSPFGEITNFDILQHLSKWKKKIPRPIYSTRIHREREARALLADKREPQNTETRIETISTATNTPNRHSFAMLDGPYVHGSIVFAPVLIALQLLFPLPSTAVRSNFDKPRGPFLFFDPTTRVSPPPHFQEFPISKRNFFTRIIHKIWLDWEVEYSILFLSWRTFIVYYLENLIRLRSLVLDSFFLGEFFFKIFWWCYICILYSRFDSIKKYSTHFSYKDFLTIMLRILRSRPDSIKKSSIRIFFFLREFFF